MSIRAMSSKALVEDVALAVVVLGGEILAASRSTWPTTAVPVGAWLVLAIGGVALVWRRTHPLVVLGVATAAVAAWHLLGYPDGPSLALLVALYTTGRYVPELRPSLLAMGVSAVVVLGGLVLDGDPVSNLAVGALLVLVPWFVGRSVSSRRIYLELLEFRAASLEREREAALRQVVAEERTRIARELHDVVAHRVSLMTVQAGAAQTVVGDDPARAARAMAAVEDAGRTALGELRHLLDVLRSDTDEEARDPAPSLADLPKLATRLEDAGVSVTLEIAELGDLGAPVELSAYRIVQESLTNALRHSGPGTHVDVTVGVDQGRLLIEVVDGGSGVPTHMDGAGRGITGMRERAESLGGTLEAGPVGTGGFRVHAVLPLREVHA